MKCTECGHENVNNPKYCTRCGNNLSGAPAAAGNQIRKTVGVEGMFDAPPASPFAPPPPPSPGPAAAPPMAGGQVRKTVLDDGGAPTGPIPQGFAPPPPPTSSVRQSGPLPSVAGMRSRTVLDEGPVTTAIAPQGGAAPTAAPSPGTARIVGWMVSYDHNAAGQDYPIRAGRNRIGRGRDNEISVFFESKASDTHATLIWRNGNAAVKDEGSTNGTLINGEDIGIGQVQQLHSGDTLTIGGSTFVVFLVDAGQARQVWPNSPWAA